MPFQCERAPTLSPGRASGNLRSGQPRKIHWKFDFSHCVKMHAHQSSRARQGAFAAPSARRPRYQPARQAVDRTEKLSPCLELMQIDEAFLS